MTAYGQCHKCGAYTGYDIYESNPNPFSGHFVNKGRYIPETKLWECYDCSKAKKPVNPLDTSEGRAVKDNPRLPGETRQEWRRRKREELKEW